MSKQDQFFSILRQSLTEQTFVRLVFSKNYNKKAEKKKVKVHFIPNEKGENLLFTNHLQTASASNITEEKQTLNRGIEIMRDLLKNNFKIANLYTTQADFAIQMNKSGEASFHQRPPSSPLKKIRENTSNFLVELGILKENGHPQKGKGDKYKQINKFVEIMAGLLQNYYKEDENKELQIIDMGAGKGYLTFALYDFLVNNLGRTTKVTGVEVRSDLVNKCNGIVQKVSFQNLQFQKGYITNYHLAKTDILIALHACDTATDDAIAKGIKAQADLIICAPCCHKQVRKLMNCQTHLQSILQYGIHNDRLAEMLTDTIRALILEANGYETSVSEFISTEHTGKNVMIIGKKRKVGNVGESPSFWAVISRIRSCRLF